MTPAELDALLSVLRRHKVAKYEDRNLTLTLSHLAFMPDGELPLMPIGAQHGNPTFDELLFASSLPVTPQELKGE